MVALVSLASPLSPRLTNFFQTCSRRARSSAKVRKGSTAERVFRMAQPCRLRLRAADGGGGLVRGGQARQTGFVRDQGPGVLVGDDLLAEAGEGVGQGGVDPAQLGLAGRVQIGARTDEGVAATLGQTLLLGAEARRVRGVGDGLDPLEQLLVEGDLVRSSGQERRQLGVDRVIGFAADVGGHHAIDVGRPVQRLAGQLQRRHGVGERRGLGVVGDCGDVGALQFDAFQHGFAQLGRRHLVEGRNAIILPSPGLQQLGARRLAGQDGAGDARFLGDAGGGRRRSGPARGRACGSAGRQGHQAAARDEKLASMHGMLRGTRSWL
jgi:hypothetical protein